jgi:hypothetical protein
MEAAFSQLTLDIIGKAVFNYDFNSLTKDSPVIQVGAPVKLPVKPAVQDWPEAWDLAGFDFGRAQPVLLFARNSKTCRRRSTPL